MDSWLVSLPLFKCTRFVSREMLERGDAKATLAVYQCTGGFFAIWICSCGLVKEHVFSSDAADAAARLATASYQSHCETIGH
jgi:hypothetical protein